MSHEIEIFTIGVYGKSETVFFSQLRDAAIDCFIDIRSRRILRGRTYSFANSVRLQSGLAERNIAYRYERDLAPTQAIRDTQRRIDKELDVTKRARDTLSQEFETQYLQYIQPFDFNTFIRDLVGFQRPVFFCVEAKPTACHRSVVAKELERRYALKITHL